MLALADAIAANVGDKMKMLRFFNVTQRISRRHGPRVAEQWLRAIARFKAGIDEKVLQTALAAQNVQQIEAAIGTSRFGQMMRGLEDPLAHTARTAGQASADVLRAGGFGIQFNAVHPDIVMFARDQTANLVVAVADETKEAIRTIVALGAQEGMTIPQQARAIREVVGLPPNWVDAPLKFEKELRAGDATAATRRRLSGTDKAQIHSRIKKGTVTDSFIKNMRERYSNSLINRRALNIARTETLRAANFGAQNSWVQGMQQGVISQNSRRFWIVTPDDRLSPQHRTIPSMNQQGRRMDEPFVTTEGLCMYPPSRPNCRCSIGLGVVPGGPPQPVVPGLLGPPPVAAPAAKKVAKKALKKTAKKKVIKKSKGLRTTQPTKPTVPAETTAPVPPAPATAALTPEEEVIGRQLYEKHWFGKKAQPWSNLSPEAKRLWLKTLSPKPAAVPTAVPTIPKPMQPPTVVKKPPPAVEGLKRTPSGMRYGTAEQAEEFVRGSQITEPLYHGTRAPLDVLKKRGIRAVGDEAREVPGISLTRDFKYAEGYIGDTGQVLRFRINVTKPITQEELERLSGLFDASELDAWAKRKGYDAIVGPNEVRVFNPAKLCLIDEPLVMPMPEAAADPFATYLRGRELLKELNWATKGTEKLLSREQIDAIFGYQNGDYFRINSILRRAQALEGELKQIVSSIDDAMLRAPVLEEEAVFWRGGKFDRLTVGDEFVDKGFVSTSSNPSVARGFMIDVQEGEGVLMRIGTPKGQRGLWMETAIGDGYESEFLLSRGMRFRVKRVRRVSWQEYKDEFGDLRISSSFKKYYPNGPQVVDVELVESAADKFLRIGREMTRPRGLVEEPKPIRTPDPFKKYNKGNKAAKQLDDAFEVCPLNVTLVAQHDGGYVYGIAAMAAKRCNIPALTQTQVRALRSYQGADYANINGLLRQPAKYKKILGSRLGSGGVTSMQKNIAVLDSVMDVMPAIGKNTVVYRGVGHGFPRLRVGQVFMDKGFTSTSIKRKLAENFVGLNNPTMVRIGLKSSQRGAWMRKLTKSKLDEGEFLLPRNTTFKVKRVRYLTLEQYEAEMGKVGWEFKEFFGADSRLRIQMVDIEVIVKK